MLLYKPWRRRIDRKRLMNATFEPLEAPADVESEHEVETPVEYHMKKDGSKTVDVSIESIEGTDLAGPSGSRR